MSEQKKIKWSSFLWDVLMCSLGSYGGPEAHYGVFSSIMVEKKEYLTQEELTEMIGLYALVPGPSSSQTITAIGYYVGGPILAFLTFLVWAFPAIVIMASFGVFFTWIDNHDGWKPVITYLPAVAVAFIIYAAYSLSRKVLKQKIDWLMYLIMLGIGLWVVDYSLWIVPGMLITGGFVYLFPHIKERIKATEKLKPRWAILGIVIGIALLNEGIRNWISTPWLTLFSSFYRYGYSVIGGGQIVIPLMIQDLVQSQSFLSLNDFLSGYAIDQAIPGPLFSFAAFVGSRSFAGSGYSFFAGILGAFSIFLPGILLVYFMFPIWRQSRKMILMKYFLKGVTVTAASLILMTAITSSMKLPVDVIVYGIVMGSALLLLSKKIPAPLIVLFVAILGFIL